MTSWQSNKYPFKNNQGFFRWNEVNSCLEDNIQKKVIHELDEIAPTASWQARI